MLPLNALSLWRLALGLASFLFLCSISAQSVSIDSSLPSIVTGLLVQAERSGLMVTTASVSRMSQPIGSTPRMPITRLTSVRAIAAVHPPW
jgi:hypothetical protein